VRKVELNIHFHFIVVVGKYLIFVYEEFLVSAVFLCRLVLVLVKSNAAD